MPGSLCTALVGRIVGQGSLPVSFQDVDSTLEGPARNGNQGYIFLEADEARRSGYMLTGLVTPRIHNPSYTY